ncbi:TIGR02611 family protein [Brevibacterium samyangense]|uniref:TIGR02611 family protein n=1 Tax=Brevibacterium samyangense TaxID=366888 RepID=A0ABP5EYU3_9MICO
MKNAPVRPAPQRRGRRTDPHGRRPAGWLSRQHRHGRPWWRRVRLEYLRKRAAIHRDPVARHLYRSFIGGLGTIVVVAGLVMVPFPGPGWVVVFLGVAIIASEFEWARGLLHRGRRLLSRWTAWVRRQHALVKFLLAAGTGAFVCAVVWVTLRITGIPLWVPFRDLVPEFLGLT